MARVAQTYAAAHQIRHARPSLRCSVAMTASPMPPVRSLPIGTLACGSVHAAYGTLVGDTGHRLLAVHHRNPMPPGVSEELKGYFNVNAQQKTQLGVQMRLTIGHTYS